MFGKIIRFMRFTKGLKQTDLAKQLGIASSTLAHYESEYRTITLEMANEIAKACDFEIMFVNKKTEKSYRFQDMKQMTYDMRIRNKDK